MIDIINLEPHEVASDINGYVIGIMGEPGCGKTTLAKHANALVLATEPGYKAIPGILAVDIQSWVDILTVNAQLKKKEAQERFDVIAIDVVDDLVFYAEQHIKQTHDVEKLTDIPYGNGYVQLAEMLKKLFKDITKNYGLLLLAHTTHKQDQDDEDIYYATLDFNKKARKIVNALVDILGYVEKSKDPNKPHILHFQPSMFWDTKTRFPHIVPQIEFSYENLVKAISDAVSEDATKTKHKDYYAEDSVDNEEFEKVKKEVEDLGLGIIKKDEAKQQEVMQLIKDTLGKKLSEANRNDYKAILALKEELSVL